MITLLIEHENIDDCLKIQCDLSESENWFLENKLYLNVVKLEFQHQFYFIMF